MNQSVQTIPCRNSRARRLAMWLFATTSLIGFGSATASSLPPAFKATYAVNKGFLKLGVAWRSLRATADGAYVYTSESHSDRYYAWIFKEDDVKRTRFIVDQGHIRPLEYHHVRERRNKLTVDQTYDWKNQQLNGSVDGKPVSYPLVDGALDQNVYQLGLMMALGSGEKDIDYNIAENKRIKSYHIEHLRDEVVNTKLGRLDSAVIRNVDKDAITTMWCAKSLHYLPVKIVYEEDGLSLTANIQSLEGMKAP